MKVWIVTSWTWELGAVLKNVEILGVFNTKREAREYKKYIVDGNNDIIIDGPHSVRMS